MDPIPDIRFWSLRSTDPHADISGCRIEWIWNFHGSPGVWNCHCGDHAACGVSWLPGFFICQVEREGAPATSVCRPGNPDGWGRHAIPRFIT